MFRRRRWCGGERRTVCGLVVRAYMTVCTTVCTTVCGVGCGEYNGVAGFISDTPCQEVERLVCVWRFRHTIRSSFSVPIPPLVSLSPSFISPLPISFFIPVILKSVSIVLVTVLIGTCTSVTLSLPFSFSLPVPLPFVHFSISRHRKRSPWRKIRGERGREYRGGNADIANVA